jgi:hypothetical protein
MKCQFPEAGFSEEFIPLIDANYTFPFITYDKSNNVSYAYNCWS